MILQALYEYYQRKAADPESKIAPEGWEWKEIPFLVVIDGKGGFVDFIDTREGDSKKKRAKMFLLPKSDKRTGNIQPFLLWDNIEYCLGANPRGRSDVEERNRRFIERIKTELADILDKPPIKALLLFLESKPLKKINSKLSKSNSWKDALESNAFIAFCLDGNTDRTICDSIRPMLQQKMEMKSMEEGEPCLVTGQKAQIARLHPAIKGVRGTNTSGAALVSFNLPAFVSYGKSQNYNAPISESLAFRYTEALNLLLGKDSNNKVTISDSTLVFWAKKSSKGYDLESDFSWFFSDSPKDDPDRGVRAVKALFNAIFSGKLPKSESNLFFVLGLSPNAARIAVRYWKVGTIRDFAEKIKLHFDDLEIAKGPKDSVYLSLNQLLRATVLQYKMENVPPNLAGSVLMSVLDGIPYPATLLQQCIRRIRAEHHVTHARAAILKAYINRFKRFYGKNEKEEIKMALDRKNPSPGYRLGRLFAVLDKIQEEASPGINATIRDRFYGAASSSPVSVFSQLLKLKNHHLGKLSQGRKGFMEKEISEIMSELSDFPPHLTMEEQARFAIGYYHQRQSFFEKKSDSKESNEEPKEAKE